MTILNALEIAMELLSYPEHAQDDEWYDKYHKLCSFWNEVKDENEPIQKEHL